jgi:hypothetical protein
MIADHENTKRSFGAAIGARPKRCVDELFNLRRSCSANVHAIKSLPPEITSMFRPTKLLRNAAGFDTDIVSMLTRRFAQE